MKKNECEEKEDQRGNEMGMRGRENDQNIRRSP